MIRAQIKDGVIRPIDPLPTEWAEGQELQIEAAEGLVTPEELDAWEQEMREGAAQIDPADHAIFLRNLQEADEQAKAWMRREMGLS